MNFLFTDEQLELRATVRGFLASKSGEESVRALMATEAGYDPAVWKQRSEQLGLTGLAVPPEYEGAGFGYLELGIVFEEMGRASCPTCRAWRWPPRPCCAARTRRPGRTCCRAWPPARSSARWPCCSSSGSSERRRRCCGWLAAGPAWALAWAGSATGWWMPGSPSG